MAVYVCQSPTDKGVSYRLKFQDATTFKWKFLPLGVVEEGVAKTGRNRLQQLLESEGQPGAQVKAWVVGLPDKARAVLVELKLVPNDDLTVGATLTKWVSREGLAPNTVKAITTSKRIVEAHFGVDTRCSSITPDAASKFRAKLATQYAEATVAKTIKHCKAWWATLHGVDADVWANVKVGSQVNRDNAAYVPLPTLTAVLAHSDNPQYRLAILLGRLAGLRIPSELRLKWSDVGPDYLSVASPKTAGQGKGGRQVPISDELRRELERLQRELEKNPMCRFRPVTVGGAVFGPNMGDESIIDTGDEDTLGQRLRKHLLLCIDKFNEGKEEPQQVKPWPRLMHNLRASLEADWLQADVPISAVCLALGHSTTTAIKHYSRTTDSALAMMKKAHNRSEDS